MSPARPPPPRRHPGAGLGAATGSVSRVAVLDLDAPTVDLPLRLPAGPLVRSLRQGGLHHYFEIGAAVPTVRTLFGIPRVELLGEGAPAPPARPGHTCWRGTKRIAPRCLNQNFPRSSRASPPGPGSPPQARSGSPPGADALWGKPGR